MKKHIQILFALLFSVVTGSAFAQIRISPQQGYASHPQVSQQNNYSRPQPSVQSRPQVVQQNNYSRPQPSVQSRSQVAQQNNYSRPQVQVAQQNVNSRPQSVPQNSNSNPKPVYQNQVYPQNGNIQQQTAGQLRPAQNQGLNGNNNSSVGIQRDFTSQGNNTPGTNSHTQGSGYGGGYEHHGNNGNGGGYGSGGYHGSGGAYHGYGNNAGCAGGAGYFGYGNGSYYGSGTYCSPSIYSGGYSCSSGGYFTGAPACYSGGFYFSGIFNRCNYAFSFPGIHSGCTLSSVQVFGNQRIIILDQYWEGFHWSIIQQRYWVPGCYGGGFGGGSQGYWDWQTIDTQQIWHNQSCSICCHH